MIETRTALAVLSTGAYQPSMVERFGRNRFVLGGLAVTLLAAGLASQWTWLVAIGVAPVLLSVAPCAAMCALGACAMGKAGRWCAATKVDPPDDTQSGTPSMRHHGHGMMSGGMMTAGCDSMMQSMNDGGRRPNVQWRGRSPEDRAMP